MERAGGPLQNKHVLIPRPEIGRSTLPDVLRQRGAQVHEMHAYAARVPQGSSEAVEELIKFSPDYVVFNSASAARNLREILGSKRTAQLAETAAFAAIGPIAAEAAAEAHMPAKIVPPKHTVPDLVAALAAFDAKRKR
jgi:uroporphyrinogen III methyltransferase/synthase